MAGAKVLFRPEAAVRLFLRGMKRLHRSQLLQALKEEFPSIAEGINQWNGLLHLEVGEFRRFTQQAIDDGDRQLVSRCFSLANRFAKDGNAKVQNAIGVSYIEDLEFRDGKVRRAWAIDLLPKSLAEMYEQFH